MSTAAEWFRRLRVVVGVAVVVAVVIPACGSGKSASKAGTTTTFVSAPDQGPPASNGFPSASLSTVDYLVGGTARSAGVYYTDTTGIVKQDNVVVPSSFSVQLASGKQLSFTVFPESPPGAPVTCQISINGNKSALRSSFGFPPSAVCLATVP